MNSLSGIYDQKEALSTPGGGSKGGGLLDIFRKLGGGIKSGADRLSQDRGLQAIMAELGGKMTASDPNSISGAIGTTLSQVIKNQIMQDYMNEFQQNIAQGKFELPQLSGTEMGALGMENAFAAINPMMAMQDRKMGLMDLMMNAPLREALTDKTKAETLGLLFPKEEKKSYSMLKLDDGSVIQQEGTTGEYRMIHQGKTPAKEWQLFSHGDKLFQYTKDGSVRLIDEGEKKGMAQTWDQMNDGLRFLTNFLGDYFVEGDTNVMDSIRSGNLPLHAIVAQLNPKGKDIFYTYLPELMNATPEQAAAIIRGIQEEIIVDASTLIDEAPEPKRKGKTTVPQDTTRVDPNEDFGAWLSGTPAFIESPKDTVVFPKTEGSESAKPPPLQRSISDTVAQTKIDRTPSTSPGKILLERRDTQTTSEDVINILRKGIYYSEVEQERTKSKTVPDTIKTLSKASGGQFTLTQLDSFIEALLKDKSAFKPDTIVSSVLNDKGDVKYDTLLQILTGFENLWQLDSARLVEEEKELIEAAKNDSIISLLILQEKMKVEGIQDSIKIVEDSLRRIRTRAARNYARQNE